MSRVQVSVKVRAFSVAALFSLDRNPGFYSETDTGSGERLRAPHSSSAAITLLPSPARKLKVRQAAKVSMVSTPIRLA